jgi:hypothetical protein
LSLIKKNMEPNNSRRRPGRVRKYVARPFSSGNDTSSSRTSILTNGIGELSAVSSSSKRAADGTAIPNTAESLAATTTTTTTTGRTSSNRAADGTPITTTAASLAATTTTTGRTSPSSTATGSSARSDCSLDDKSIVSNDSRLDDSNTDSDTDDCDSGDEGLYLPPEDLFVKKEVEAVLLGIRKKNNELLVSDAIVKEIYVHNEEGNVVVHEQNLHRLGFGKVATNQLKLQMDRYDSIQGYGLLGRVSYEESLLGRSCTRDNMVVSISNRLEGNNSGHHVNSHQVLDIICGIKQTLSTVPEDTARRVAQQQNETSNSVYKGNFSCPQVIGKSFVERCVHMYDTWKNVNEEQKKMIPSNERSLKGKRDRWVRIVDESNLAVADLLKTPKFENVTNMNGLWAVCSAGSQKKKRENNDA